MHKSTKFGILSETDAGSKNPFSLDYTSGFGKSRSARDDTVIVAVVLTKRDSINDSLQRKGRR